MSSNSFVFEFQYDKKSDRITQFNRDAFQSPLTFDDFFRRYLNTYFLFSDKSKFDFGKVATFFSTGEVGSRLDIVSMDEKKFFFEINDVRDGKTNLSLYRIGDSNEDKDFLTGINSRSYLFHYLIQELNNHDGKNSYLIMVDLDNFKQINDNFGHMVGDACLRAIAEKLNDIFKGYAFGRYGGDEFLVYLHDVSEEKMTFLVKKALEVKFRYEKSFLSRSGVTCSLGITSPIKGNRDLSSLIKEADEALYHSKKKGKNTATVYPNRVISNQSTIKKDRKVQLYYQTRTDLLFKEEIQKKKRRNSSILLSILAVFILIVVSVSLNFNYESNKQTEAIAERMSKDRADDVQSQTKRKMEEAFDELTQIAEVMKNYHSNVQSSYEGFQSLISRIKSNTSIKTPALLLDDGSVFISKDEITNFVGLPIDFAITEGKNYVDRVDSVSFSSNNNMIVFGVPFVYDEGTSRVKGLLSLFDISDFASSLFLDSFLSSAYFAIVTQKGTKICDNSSDSFTYFNGNNIFNQLNKDDLLDYENTLRTSFDQKDKNISLFHIHGKRYYFYNQNLEGADRDWVLLSVIPFESASAYLGNISKFGVVYFNVFCCFAFIIFLCLTIILQKTKMNYFISQYIDPLTKSINEQRFFIDASTLVQRDSEHYYLVYLNIKRFKFINNQNGTEYANSLLGKIGEYFNRSIQPNEIVSREYSDRFIMLLNCSSSSECQKRMEKILAPISEGQLLQTTEKLHMNVGFYKIENKKEPIWLAIDRARSATNSLYTFDNINGYKFFDQKMMERAELEIYIEQSQEAAMRNHAFQVYYQGKYNLKKECFTSVEALVRWKDENKGFINTQTFVDVFEKNGFIVKLDLYVFEQVLKDISLRLKEHKRVIPISINLSRRHFDLPSFFDEYEELIRKYDIDGRYLEFEITESVILNSQINLEDTIRRIHALGSTVSIDDFGSGFSNFSMINHIDFDILKIDKKLLSGKNGFDSYSKNILKMIVMLNKSLDKTVVCEGVENKVESDYLKDIGCDLIQGYYYCKPQPLASFQKLLDGETVSEDKKD